MNFQASEVLPPLNVLLVNPLSMEGRMLCIKIICGTIFGADQLIQLILSVNPHEKPQAEDYVLELRSCGFSTMNSVVVSTNLPTIADADVFIIITNFDNPNIVNFHESLRKNVDAVYSVINVALSLSQSISIPEEPIDKPLKNIEVKKKHKPLFVADGIVTLNILKYFLKDNLPSDIFICPNPLPAIARQVLGEHLRTTTNLLNTLYVWGVDDQTFYIEVALPVVLSEQQDVSEIQCNQKIVGNHIMDRLNYDVTNFNEAWMKKDFIVKTHASSLKNTYGDIYRAITVTRTLRKVWTARCAPEGVETSVNMGIISDGSLQTIKGYAYFMPVLLSGDTWKVNQRFSETSYLQQEIQRFNKSVKAFKEINNINANIINAKVSLYICLFGTSSWSNVWTELAEILQRYSYHYGLLHIGTASYKRRSREFNPYCKKFLKDNENKLSLGVTETDSFTSYGIRSGAIRSNSMTYY